MSDYSRMMELAMGANMKAAQEALGMPEPPKDAPPAAHPAPAPEPEKPTKR